MTVLAPTMWECDVMELLRQHVPLTLLIDLVDPTGPHSREVAASEHAASAA